MVLSHGDVSTLRSLFPKIGYNGGVYGWNWDAFEVSDDIVVVAGYRSFPRIDYSLDYDSENRISRAYNMGDITQKQARARFVALIKRTMSRRSRPKK